jgi:uncharacterized protein (DUF1499 family)
MGWLRKLPLLAAATLAACAGKPPPELGVRDGRLAACPTSPNCVSSQAADDRHRIVPLAFRGDPDAAWARLGAILSARDDTRVLESQADYLRVEFRTRIGFVDDAEFALDRDARVIHARSASRVGYSDLGKNRRRIEEIREVL